MKYVPILRYRQEERAALRSLALTAKTMPLIELVKDKPNANMKGNFKEAYERDLDTVEVPFMVDFPVYLPLNASTQDDVRSFLLPLKRDRKRVITRFIELSSVANLVPVLSYDPYTTYAPGSVAKEAAVLRQNFPRLAFRVHIGHFDDLVADLVGTARTNDIAIFDLDKAPHSNPVLQAKYQKMQRLKSRTGCITVLARAALGAEITNVGLSHGQPIAEADNSLLTMFGTYKFDTFGDFAGIKKDLLQKGGSVSPGLIYYYWTDNCYMGYRGNVKALSEFRQHIVPSLVASPLWKALSPQHLASCPGCKYVAEVHSGNQTGANQAIWKRASIMHYIHTMEESL